MTKVITIALASCAVIVVSAGAAYARGHHGGGGNAYGMGAMSHHDSQIFHGYSRPDHKSPIVPTHRSPILNGNIPHVPVHGSPALGGARRPVSIVRNHQDCSKMVRPLGCSLSHRGRPDEGGLSYGEKPAHFTGYLPQGGRVRDHRH